MTGTMRLTLRRIARQGAGRLIRSRSAERLRSWMRGTGPASRFGIDVHGDRSSADVIAYFGETADQLYQLRQWLPALEALNSQRPVALVFRQRGAFDAAKKMTELPSILAVSQPDLVDLYAAQSYRAALYVNNGMRNFQSMAEASIVHVHVDHGESDKKSSISNQLKAYDRVFLAGPAAIDRCERALWQIDRNKLVTVGRPPLDGNFVSVLPHDDRRTVVYAPTWQGESEANNFTSVDALGPQIVESLLSANVRVVYRPHPRVEGTNDTAMSTAGRVIRTMIQDANDEGGAHVVSTESRILDIFEDADVLIADVSSVGLDFLYLHPDKGLILTDRHNDSVRMELNSPLGAGIGTLTLDNVGQLPQMIEESLHDEAQLTSRKRLKKHYFGMNTAGDSTGQFIKAVDDAIREREADC